MSKSLYDNLDNCINLLFNAIYGKSDKCYAINPIKRKSITLDDLRKPLNYDPTNVFDGEFKLIEKNKYRIEYKRTNKDGTACNVAIGEITKNQNDITRPELQHMAMLYMGSEIVFNEKFRGIELPIMCFDINRDKLFELFPKIKEDMTDKNFGENMYVIVTEHFFKTEKLGSYLDNNINNLTESDIKNIIFQIFFILAKLSERFNNFTHRGIDLNSILVWKNETKEKKQYKLGNIVFEIDSDIDLKFTNFDKSSTSDYNSYNNINNYNPYYDIYIVIKNLDKYLKSKNINMVTIQSFFDEILPEKIRDKDILSSDTFQINSEELITAISIIKKNKFFKEFIKMDLSVSPKEFTKENMNDLKQKGSGISYIENNKKNKKSSKYYSMSTYKGSRRIAVPGFNKTGLTSEYSDRSNLFTGGDSERTEVNPNVTSTATESTVVGTEKPNKKDQPSSSSVSVSNKNDKEKQSSSSASVSASVSGVKSSPRKEKSDIIQALEEEAKMARSKGKKGSNKSKDKKSKHKVEESSTMSALSVSSGGARSSRKSKGDIYNNLKINPKHAELLKKLPESYLDIAPEGMVGSMPSIDQMQSMEAMGMQGMNPMAMQGMQGMEGMNPMAMQGMQQQQQLGQAELAQLQQLSAYPPMPNSMSAHLPGGMQGMQGMPGMPGMAGMQGMQGMPGMGQMFGGSKIKKYKFNRDKLNQSLGSNFFF
jgi:hypothetical protein